MENSELGGRGSCVAARGRSSRCVSGWRTSRRVTWDRGSGMRCAPRGSRGPQEGQRWCCGLSPRTERERSGHRRASRLPSLRPSPLCPSPGLSPAPGVSASTRQGPRVAALLQRFRLAAPRAAPALVPAPDLTSKSGAPGGRLVLPEAVAQQPPLAARSHDLLVPRPPYLWLPSVPTCHVTCHSVP